MKWLVLFLLVSGCTKKYYDYAYINKSEFTLTEQSSEPVSKQRPPKLRAGKKTEESFCSDQILFNRNAYDISFKSIPALVNQSCPGSEHLLNARISQTWWTALVYSKSCVTVKSRCPQKQ